MGYIYIIKNRINDKVYIGKTDLDINKRFKEHLKDSRRRRCEKRPLYSAMRKYGCEHFYVELIEETQDTSTREQFWIKEYNSFHYGYNATIGGDGSEYVNRELIISEYNKHQMISAVRKITGHDAGTIRKILKEAGINIRWSQDAVKKELGKHVAQIDVNTGKTINVFITIKAAAKAFNVDKSLIQNALRRSKKHISLGYVWKEITYEEYEQFTRNNNSSSENSQDNKCIQMDI